MIWVVLEPTAKGNTSFRNSPVLWFHGLVEEAHTQNLTKTINLEKEKKKYIYNNKPACSNLPP